MLFRVCLTALPLVLAAPAVAQSSLRDGAEVEAEEQGDDVVVGNDIVVTGRAAKLYRVEQTASGKMPTEPLASSQTITVITEELIEDQGARDAQDLYRNISGVPLTTPPSGFPGSPSAWTHLFKTEAAPDTPPPQPTTPAWAEGVAYKVGDKVTYGGSTYTCLQAHSSQAGWTPAAVPSLWTKN